jgi:hypothetical protein
MPLTLQSPLKCAYRCIMDTDATPKRENATRIIGIEVAAVGIAIQLLCMWNSLNPFDTSNRDLVNFFFCVGTLVVAVGCGVYAKGKGRHPAFGLFGILSIPGFFVLSLLKDKPEAQ